MERSSARGGNGIISGEKSFGSKAPCETRIMSGEEVSLRVIYAAWRKRSSDGGIYLASM